MTVFVSIVMSAYNAAPTIREAVDSVLAQTYSDFEFIIIDDASTDDTASIVSAYSDPRLILLRNETNLNLAASLNKGLAHAKGEYIARMDADDIMLPERLAVQVGLLNDNPDIGVLGSFAENIGTTGRKRGINKKPTKPEDIKAISFFTCPMIHPTVMFRRDILPADGKLYDESFSRAQDMECWSRLAHRAKFMNTEKVLLKYRHQSKKNQKKMKGELNYFRGRIAERNLSYLLKNPDAEDIKNFMALLGWGKASVEGVAAIAAKLREANAGRQIYVSGIFEGELAKRVSKYLKKNSTALTGINMTKFKKYLGVIITGVLLAYALYLGASYWQERQIQKRTLSTAREIAKLCLDGKDPKSAEAKIEILRSCIHANTQHKMGEEFHRNWRDSSKMAGLVLDYMQGRKPTKPEFECSTRSTLLSRVLKIEGMGAKSITVIKNYKSFPDHVILQVSDQAGNKWLEDTSYDVTIMKKGKMPATLSDFLQAKDIEPCRAGKCGWSLPRADIGPVSDLKAFPAAYLREKDKRKSVLYYDPSRFDPEHKGANDISYCEAKRKWCRTVVPVR